MNNDFDLFSKSSVVVLDLTHAGIIIAQKLAEFGLNVTAVDVYKTVDDDTLKLLESQYGIKTCKSPTSVDNFDVIVSPVHLDPEYEMLVSARNTGKNIISHHKIVGMILHHNKKLQGMKIIEITGSKAKTSSASILADMLSREMVVLLHTSRGLEIWRNGIAEKIYSGLSIAPGSILLALDEFESTGIDVDCCIFEVSIGGTGIGDIGIISTLEPDYGIAKSSSLASDAKLQMVEYAKSDGLMILNANDEKAIKRAEELGRNIITFTDSNNLAADIQVRLDGKVVSLISKDASIDSIINSFYNAFSYTTAFVVSGAVALNMGIDPNTISDVISGFIGLAGRMQETELNGRVLIDNSNSGMDIKSAEKSLDHGRSKIASESKIIMVLGEEAEQVCEGLPPENVQEFVRRRKPEINKLILVGERMRDIAYDGAIYSPDTGSGLEEAMELSSKGDLIISCVKCFR